MIFEYGAMSSKYSIEADDKLTAYAGMIAHFGGNAAMIALYGPDDCKKDSWLFASPLEDRLNEVFGGSERAFFDYMDNHTDEIRKAVGTIKKLV